jgi:hypothetical protein
VRFGDELGRFSPWCFGGMGEGSLEECEDKLPEKKKKKNLRITTILNRCNQFFLYAVSPSWLV